MISQGRGRPLQNVGGFGCRPNGRLNGFSLVSSNFGVVGRRLSAVPHRGPSQSATGGLSIGPAIGGGSGPTRGVAKKPSAKKTNVRPPRGGGPRTADGARRGRFIGLGTTTISGVFGRV